MTRNQRIFADEYIKTRNATRAYMVAYPHIKNENTAAAGAYQILRNIKVSEYIEQQLNALHDETIADAVEIMRFYSKVMRGELGETIVDARGDEHQTAAKISDRTQAADKLARMLGKDKLIEWEKHRMEMERETEQGGDTVQIVDDV